MAKGIIQPDESSFPKYQASRVEGSQLKIIKIQPAPGFGVTVEKDLESSVKMKTIHDIGSDATTYGVGGLQDTHIDSILL